MRQTRTLLLVLMALLAILGLGVVMLASIGDASVVASTGGVYHALETAGVGNDVSLRNRLYAIVLRLKDPWAAVQLGGALVFFLALTALITAWRLPKPDR